MASSDGPYSAVLMLLNLALISLSDLNYDAVLTR